ncbi:hypothetical protein [Methanogenium cariaci]|uniref:hypothetical protein n=1 Tax=Methanogenium cariaci TaxID=2197 RepID=UPI0007853CDC|nr:hypothetical protein [Methanogenium cariaci]
MKKDGRQQLSLQTSFSLVIFLVFIVLTISVSAILYSSMEKNIVSQFEEKMDQTAVSVTHSAILADKGLILYEKAYETQIEAAFTPPFLEAYDQSGGNPGTIDLDALKTEMEHSDWEIDLYVINESGVIEYTTFEPDRDLISAQFLCFIRQLLKYVRGDNFSADRVCASLSDPDEGKNLPICPLRTTGICWR